MLVGFMGAGKSTVGKAVAERLGMAFTDSDDVIERRYGSVPVIFSERGEEAFRGMEREIVLELLGELEKTPAVLALGGGAVTDPDVREALRNAQVVWLTAPPDLLWSRVTREERLEGRGDLRPLARDEAAFLELFRRRETLYRDVADVTVDTSGSWDETVDQVVHAVTNER